MNKTVMVAIGYARTSNASNPEASIPNQIEIIKKYCEQNNMLLKQVFIDEKKSGMSTDNRFEYQRLKEIVLQGRIDAVIVSFFDRVARESFEFISMMFQMKRHGVDLISVREDLVGSKMTPLEIAMIGIKIEMENNARSKRVRDGKLKSIEKGNYTFSLPPFGYTITKDKKLAIIEKEAEMVKWIYDAYEEGKSINEIYEHLNSTNIRQGKKWKFIGNILEEHIYTGERELPPSMQKQLPNIRAKAPAIISKEQFERVQKIRVQKKRDPNAFYFLTQGPFICPNCKGKIYPYNQKTMYYCKKARIKKNADCLRYEIDVLDKKVLSFLIDWIDSQQQAVYKTDQGEELLQEKAENEKAFAIAKISYKTFLINSEKIIRQYKELDSESFITPLSRIKTLTSLVKEERLEEIKAYMKQNEMVLTMNDEQEVILFNVEND